MFSVNLWLKCKTNLCEDKDQCNEYHKEDINDDTRSIHDLINRLNTFPLFSCP